MHVKGQCRTLRYTKAFYGLRISVRASPIIGCGFSRKLCVCNVDAGVHCRKVLTVVSVWKQKLGCLFAEYQRRSCTTWGDDQPKISRSFLENLKMMQFLYQRRTAVKATPVITAATFSFRTNGVNRNCFCFFGCGVDVLMSLLVAGGGSMTPVKREGRTHSCCTPKFRRWNQWWHVCSCSYQSVEAFGRMSANGKSVPRVMMLVIHKVKTVNLGHLRVKSPSNVYPRATTLVRSDVLVKNVRQSHTISWEHANQIHRTTRLRVHLWKPRMEFISFKQSLFLSWREAMQTGVTPEW